MFSGFAGAQLLSFARNALLGHALSRGDFGIAATLTLLLQLLDTLTDLGADRLIVQARDGNRPTFIACQHTALVARGVLTALALYLCADLIAAFFAIPHAAPAFALIALVPLIKGFQHLDPRRAQRRLDNRPYLLVEILPQAAALALTVPILTWAPDFNAVVWLSLAQAVALTVTSHLVAQRRYRLAWDPQILKRLIEFGWPIWLSAFPLIAVFHGDRIIIARFLGMEELAAYTAAFMITMVPGLIAAKVGHALMLPLFADARDAPHLLAQRFAAMSEATVFLASVYLITAMLVGGFILQIAFGPQYTGLSAIVAWLAAMWALRMLQAVPGMALMAAGQTTPFLVAGLIRSGALIPAAFAALMGFGLEMVAAAGVVGELASIAYVTWRLKPLGRDLGRIFMTRALFLAPAALLGILAVLMIQAENGPMPSLGALMLALAVTSAMMISAFPDARGRVRAVMMRRPA